MATPGPARPSAPAHGTTRPAHSPRGREGGAVGEEGDVTARLLKGPYRAGRGAGSARRSPSSCPKPRPLSSSSN